MENIHLFKEHGLRASWHLAGGSIDFRLAYREIHQCCKIFLDATPEEQQQMRAAADFIFDFEEELARYKERQYT